MAEQYQILVSISLLEKYVQHVLQLLDAHDVSEYTKAQRGIRFLFAAHLKNKLIATLSFSLFFKAFHIFDIFLTISLQVIYCLGISPFPMTITFVKRLQKLKY